MNEEEETKLREAADAWYRIKNLHDDFEYGGKGASLDDCLKLLELIEAQLRLGR